MSMPRRLDRRVSVFVENTLDMVGVLSHEHGRLQPFLDQQYPFLLPWENTSR